MTPLIRFGNNQPQFGNNSSGEEIKLPLNQQQNFPAQLLNNIQGEFTGRLDLEFLPSQLWSLYFHSGYLIWANDNFHQTRRWYRYMSYYCPQINFEQVHLRQTDIFECWDYHLLTILAQRGYIHQEQVLEIIKRNCQEVLFHIFQKIENNNLRNYTDKKKPLLSYVQTQQNEQLNSSLPLHIHLGAYPSHQIFSPVSNYLSLEKMLQEVQQMWRQWTEVGLTYCSPNLAPIIKNKLQLQQKTTASKYQKLVTLVNGQRTLRDLAYLMQQDVFTLTKSLAPHVRKQLIGLLQLPDLARPSLIQSHTKHQIFNAKQMVSFNQILVACIDDNLQFCSLLENTLTKIGHRCLIVQDPIQALPLLLQHNPEIIFLNLFMPIVSGYEICGQIRRIARFKVTPIIFISENLSVVEKLRAKMAGATDFMTKPIDEAQLIRILFKYKS